MTTKPVVEQVKTGEGGVELKDVPDSVKELTSQFGEHFAGIMGLLRARATPAKGTKGGWRKGMSTPAYVNHEELLDVIEVFMLAPIASEGLINKLKSPYQIELFKRLIHMTDTKMALIELMNGELFKRNVERSVGGQDNEQSNINEGAVSNEPGTSGSDPQ